MSIWKHLALRNQKANETEQVLLVWAFLETVFLNPELRSFY